MKPLELLALLAKKKVQPRTGEHIETMSFLVQKTGLDTCSIPLVLITGTCGKGSTLQFLSGILEAHGYNVGSVQSPHLVSFSERIQWNRKPLDELVILDEMEELMPDLEAAVQIHPLNYNQVFLTTGLHLFQKLKADFILIESGIGGYSDPCSFFDPIFSIITNIHKDHEFLLGNRYESIAYDKSGVIKPHRPIVTGTTIESAFAVIEQEAQKKHAPLFSNPRDFHIEGDGSVRTYVEPAFQLPIQLQTLGEHQWNNASIAIKSSRLLSELGYKIEPNLIAIGLHDVSPPGRFEQVADYPIQIIDGAHNEEEIRLFCETVRSLGCNNHYFIIGFSNNKDMTGMLNQILLLKGTVLLVPHSNVQRSASMEELNAFCSGLDNCISFHNLQKAYDYAIQHASKDDGIFITGSMFLAGDALQLIKKRDRNKGMSEQ